MFTHEHEEKNKNNTGFTLIELLVVISIIGLLASVVLVSLNKTRIKARDTKRVADLKQVRTALELYASDNGHYPNTNNTWSCFDCITYLNTAVISPAAANISTALSPYIKTPKDPKRTSAADSGYLYISNAGGTEFKIMAYLTPENMNNFDTTTIDPYRCGTPTTNGLCTGSISGWNTPVVGFWTANAQNY